MSEWDNSAQNCSIKMATHNDLTIVKPNKLDVMGKLDIMDRTTSVVKEEQSLSYRYCK